MDNKVPIKLLFILLVTICLVPVFGHPKGDELRKKSLAADKGVTVFTAASFKEFVMRHPRPYDVVILFTLKYKCNICEAVKNEFGLVAESFIDAGVYKPDMYHKKRAVFFGILYYSEETNSIFKSLKLPSTTSILYTTPQNIHVDDNNEPYIKYDEDFVIGYKDRPDQVFAHKILEFVNAKGSRKVELKKNPLLFILYFIMFLGILVLGYSLFTNFKQVFLSPYVWLIGTFIIFIVCIGGIVYNIIHHTPFAKFDRDGNIVEFIHSGQRSQYIGEGLLMSTLFVTIGTLLMSFNWINKIRGYWPHRIAALIIIFLIAILSRVVTAIYQKKASWYGPTFYPPSGYTRGPLIKDQGNSF